MLAKTRKEREILMDQMDVLAFWVHLTFQLHSSPSTDIFFHIYYF